MTSVSSRAAYAESQERPKVFISYSRKDLAPVEALRDVLIAEGVDAYLDLHDILPGEPWGERLAKLIEVVDTVVFVLSPYSVTSDIVNWEGMKRNAWESAPCQS
jgi:hypothetical protein